MGIVLSGKQVRLVAGLRARVQERVLDNVPAGSSGKWWAVDIYGYSVPGGAKQDVYWAVWVRKAE